MPPPTEQRVVIIGAGIVGANVADELVQRGWKNITVIEQGPLGIPGGSTSHAPGLVFQTNPSKAMTQFAKYTVSKLQSIEKDGQNCFNQVGGLEIATTQERLQELKRKAGYAASWGVETQLLSPAECERKYPILKKGGVLGGLYIPSDGLALAARATQILIERTSAAGVKYMDKTAVTAVNQHNGCVSGVVTSANQTIPADLVISCAGFWGVEVGAMVGLPIPLVPMGHQYVRTTPIASQAGKNQHPKIKGQGATLPILRYQDEDLYYREHDDYYGIGYYGHRPMPVVAADLGQTPSEVTHTSMPSRLEFTPDDFAPAWDLSRDLLPALQETEIADGFNGLLSFTPDGGPLMGQSPTVTGFWVAEAVWVTHSAGIARALAEILTSGTSSIDSSVADLHRFDRAQLTPQYITETSTQNFVEVYDIVHPFQPRNSPRNLRVSPFHDKQRDLDAVFMETGGWERPEWYGCNQKLLSEIPREWAPKARDSWSSQFYSPIIAAEAWKTRTAAGLYDLTANRRIEVQGPGALSLLQRLTTSDISSPVGSITYTLLLNGAGGILSDITVARTSPDNFQLGANSASDWAYLAREAKAQSTISPLECVTVSDVTGATTALGLWGPNARHILAAVSKDDLSTRAIPYSTTKSANIAGIPCTIMALSIVGEAGVEIHASAEYGRYLWDALTSAGQQHGLVAAGRGALYALRIERGYRLWGADMTTEHNPYETGLSHLIAPSKRGYVGSASLKSLAQPSRQLRTLVVEDGQSMVMGKEPVYKDGAVQGYVTTAAFGYTIGRPIALAMLASDVKEGDVVEIEYFARKVSAKVVGEPAFDANRDKVKLARRVAKL